MGEERSSIPQLSIQSRSEYGRTRRLLYGWRNGAVFTPMTTRRAAKSFKTSTILTSSSTSSTTTSQRNLASGICSTKCFKLGIISRKIKKDHQKEHIAIGEKKEKEICYVACDANGQCKLKKNMRSKQHHREITSFFSPNFFLLFFSCKCHFIFIFVCTSFLLFLNICAFVTLCYTSCHFLFSLYHEFQRMYHFLLFVTAASKILFKK